MAARGPIYGGELVAVIQGGQRVWANRDQVKAILAAQDMNPKKPAGNGWIKPSGDETFPAIQGGERVSFSAADLNAWLASTTTSFERPAGRGVLTAITGAELLPIASGGVSGFLDIGDVGLVGVVATPLFIQPKIVIANGATWTAASGGSVNNAGAFSKQHPSGRTQGLVFTKNPTSGTFAGFRSVAVPADFRLSDYAFIGLDGLPNLLSGSVSIRFSSDNFATKRVEYSWPMPGQLYGADWNRVTARVLADTSGIDPNGAWTVVGGMLMTETINAVQISINTAANDAANIGVDQVLAWTGQPAKGVIMLGFDRYTDSSLVNIALPMAQAYGITMYAAGDTDLVAGMGVAWGRVRQLHDAGWPIISQGPDHKDYVAAGAGQLTTDYAASRQVLINVGLGNALDFFAYPFSANNAATDAALVAAGCKIATTGISWNSHPGEYHKIGYKLVGLARINIGGLTWTQIKALLDRAALYGIVLDLFCHGVASGGDGQSAHADPLLVYESVLLKAVQQSVTYRNAGLIDIHNPVTLYLARAA